MSDAAKTEWGLESLRLFASVMRKNGVNPSKEESLDAIRVGDTCFSVNLKVEDDELNDIPIFTQMKDEVLDFSSHALHSRGITEMLLDNLSYAEHEERLPKRKRKQKGAEGRKGVQQQDKKKQKKNKNAEDTTVTQESSSRGSSKRKQIDGSSHISKITHTTQEEDDENEEEDDEGSEGKVGEEDENEEGEEEANIDDSPNRRSLWQRAAAAQQRQAEAVNKHRGKQCKKKILEVGDIGLIKVEENVKAATDFPWLPVAVVKIHPGKGELSPPRYSVCSRDGYLKGTFG